MESVIYDIEFSSAPSTNIPINQADTKLVEFIVRDLHNRNLLNNEDFFGESNIRVIIKSLTDQFSNRNRIWAKSKFLQSIAEIICNFDVEDQHEALEGRLADSVENILDNYIHNDDDDDDDLDLAIKETLDGSTQLILDIVKDLKSTNSFSHLDKLHCVNLCLKHLHESFLMHQIFTHELPSWQRMHLSNTKTPLQVSLFFVKYYTCEAVGALIDV